MYFSKTERVIIIQDEDVKSKYIFPRHINGRLVSNAISVISNSAVGNGSPFLPAHADSDRKSDLTLINVDRVKEVVEQTVKVPSAIESKINSYDNLVAKEKSKEISDEELEEKDNLKEELISYFDID